MNSMSFGDLPFAGVLVGIIEQTCQKYTNNIATQTPDMSPRGEGPLTRQIRAQPGGEKSTKHKANVLQMTPNSIGPLYKVTGGHQPNLGSFGPS